MTVPASAGPAPSGASPAALLRLADVSKHFGGVAAVDRVSFDVPAGAVVGLIGPNGAGKSTAFNIAAGLERPNGGSVVFCGEDVTGLASHERYGRGLSRTFQIAQEFHRLTVLENLMVAAREQPGETLRCALFGRGRMRAAERRTFDKASEIVDLLDLGPVRDHKAGEVSGGQKKLVELGRALMSDPKIILLDEIGAGVNRSLLGKIAEKIQDLNARRGCTFCLVEHDLDFIERLCGHVVVMVQGRVLTQGSVAEVRRDARVIEAYFGGGKYH